MSNLFPTYAKFPIEIVEGKGTVVKDANGKEYLDFTSGIAVCNLGHCNEAVLAAVQQQLTQIWHTSNLFESSIQEQVADKLTAGSKRAVFFCNSGAEANEAALKLAKKHTGCDEIITFQQSFHGRTIATMTATGQGKIHDGFGALLPGFTYLPYNDLEALEQTISEQTAAVMLEIIQGEGGVIPATTEFLQGASALCAKYGALLIIDEVQTGMGRTGKRFAFEHAGIEPDIFTLAKGLGNGLPVGAMIGKAELAESFGSGVHGSTFGGNKIAMAAADVVIDHIFEEAFLAEVTEKGAYFQALLAEQLPGVVIRGKGLMFGIELETEAVGVVKSLQEAGVLTLTAGPNVLRILPPLTVTKTELEQVAEKLAVVLKKQEMGMKI
ncbi:acetylornithine transaminase [Listeria booriae]|uniref:acetylornithine transaminase n=1 Tax=Listeria booriae TaxID=1552123 RepID=UPI00162A8687|nr:acetylornithine transaminase [Listeria booriae]MBC1976767.1 acetylornithine transaminase [Listeria booriae]MBC1982992.1 acetylornithine transaminase [Listeria booriae]MBC2034464.1 acetylornithine transaminase [Listeria booriae]MBC2046339.1 acetylornithine transaminase [Listeria booriae]MBC2317504.1 acetylornithine transaminase [Listeria booriae]